MADIQKPTEKNTIEKDYVTNKVLLVFTLCLFGVFGLMLLHHIYYNASTARVGVILWRIVTGAGFALLAFGVFKTLRERSSKEDLTYRIVRGRYLIVISAVILLCVLAERYSAVKLFYVILPVLAVYYLIFHSYPREFFVIAVDSGLAAGLLYMVRHVLSGGNYPYYAYLCVAIALALALVQSLVLFKLQSRKKVFGLVDGRRVQLFTAAHAYQIMYLTAVLMLVLVAAGAFLGTQVAYYLIFAALGYLFITAVYYTVKLM